MPLLKLALWYHKLNIRTITENRSQSAIYVNRLDPMLFIQKKKFLIFFSFYSYFIFLTHCDPTLLPYIIICTILITWMISLIFTLSDFWFTHGHGHENSPSIYFYVKIHFPPLCPHLTSSDHNLNKLESTKPENASTQV